jgi:ectoine hydroxylase-related dioxygenase (phytanoyl-CoA dioxygenase family)
MLEACSIDVDAVESYHAQGYVVVRSVFSSDEMEDARRETEALFRRNDLIDVDNLRCRWQNHYETGECRFDTFDPVIDLSGGLDRLAREPRILNLLASLYEEPACLFKDKLIFKPPGAVGYGLHQDYISWPCFPRSFVTVLVPLDSACDENGCTEVFPGYHKAGYLSPGDGEYHELATSNVDESSGVRLVLEPGDLAVFGCMTPHRSGPNRSQNWRRQLYLSYNAFSDGGDQRIAHYREFHAWLRTKYAEYGRRDVYFA